MNKFYHLILILGLALIGCAKNELAESPAANAPGEGPAPVVNSGIGTEGGGGTLVFAFRQGAITAMRAMEQNTEIAGKDPLQDGLNLFYRLHRERWIKALEQFVFDPEMVKETSETLTENDVPVGAKSLPVNAPTKVRLSVPYLSGKEGFTFSKAFALAVHEAGHFAKPDLSQAEHPYLDQIANLLFFKREGISQRKEFRLKAELDRDSVLVASDGRTMMALGWKTLSTIDIESGIRLDEDNLTAQILHRNWVAASPRSIHQISEARRVILRNQVTREHLSVTVPANFVLSGFLADERTLVMTEKVEDTKRGKILLHDIRSGEVRTVHSIPKPIPVTHYDGEYRMQLQANGFSAVIADTQTGNVIDFIQASKEGYVNSQAGYFISNKLALLQWHHTGVDIEFELREIGKESLAMISGTHYLGTLKKGKQFALTRPGNRSNVPGILIYDIEAKREEFHPVPMLDKALRFENQTALAIERSDSTVWASDLKDLSKQERVSAEDTREGLLGAFPTVEGRVVATYDYDSKEIIVRYLDRK